MTSAAGQTLHSCKGENLDVKRNSTQTGEDAKEGQREGVMSGWASQASPGVKTLTQLPVNPPSPAQSLQEVL